MPMTPELIAKIALWHAKQKEGTMTLKDWQEAMLDLREKRTAAQAAAQASRKAKGPVDTQALKDSLRAFAKKA